MIAAINDSALRGSSDLPSPRGLPLLGNAFQVDPPRMHLILEQWAEEFGSAFTISLGPKRISFARIRTSCRRPYPNARIATGAFHPSSRP
jgi:hypothetical protein